MTFFDDLISLGVVQDTSDVESLRTLKRGDRFYVGIDPTAPSLQVGNLVPLTMCLRLAQAGLEPIILFGGATGAIGDPSGKSAERKLLPREVIEENIALQTKQVTELFGRHSVTPLFVNNFVWTHGVSILDFLRDIGKHFTVNYMIAKEVVKTRLSGDGISYTEFSYMLLQAFDFLHLYESHRCRMQIGGSDQWGNITAGLELIRRKKGETDAVAFSIPLLTTADGKKFGKSETGTLWLDPTMTSPYQFHQFWLNTPDSEVGRALKVFTLLPPSAISEWETTITEHPEKREAQRFLADYVTNLVHGQQGVASAHRGAQVFFGGSLEEIPEAELLGVLADVPSVEIPRSEALTLSVTDLLVQTKVIKSKGEVRRLVEGGGLSLNNKKVSEADLASPTPYLTRSVLVVRMGKKSFSLIKFT